MACQEVFGSNKDDNSWVHCKVELLTAVSCGKVKGSTCSDG